MAVPRPTIASVVSLGGHRYGKDPARYPFWGVQYLATHSSLWTIALKIICISSILSIIILTALMITALKPQAVLINAELPWWAWFIAVLMVFVEAAVATSILMLYSQARAQTKIFEATMRLESRWRDEMVQQSILKDFNLCNKSLWVRIITLPIQIIPFVGGALYSAINATFTGWDYMDRYFDAIQLSVHNQRIEIFGDDGSQIELCDCWADCWSLLHPSTYDINNDYARFGFTCSYMESVPIFGWTVFPLTNAIGSALFACDIEKCGGPACLKSHNGNAAM
ncbi:hypothetical protein ACHAWO_004714 [Cyclotella atomus]|uniref:Uncharacterized protein n=1 Tax=Cyclotella atomus TaxID=382360 RepID=A0ABD3NN44_9STRA